MMASSLVTLPLVNLQTANDTDTQELLKEDLTVIDFWTTRCVRCPAALDKMQERASQQQQQIKKNIKFVSVCLGTDLDTCRNKIEEKDQQWDRIEHYFARDKEAYKEAFQFSQVPFYLVVEKDGTIRHSGNKIDYDSLVEQEKENEPENREQQLLVDDFDLDF